MPLAAVLWLGLGSAAPADSLVTGAVRDTKGFAVSDARVSGLDRTGKSIVSARTDADGTFALDGSATPVRVRIECPYCRTLEVAVTADQPVAAIVQRYGALLSTGPGSGDLAVLPYARLEDALALHPFSVLRLQPPIQAQLYPALSDRGLARTALILDGMAPTYDAAAPTTALGLIPAHGGNDAGFGTAAQAYRYGLYATGGTIALNRDPTNIEQGSFGDARSLRISAGTSNAGFTAATDTDDTMQHARIAAGANMNVAGGQLTGSVATTRADLATPADVRASERSANLAYSRQFDRIRLDLTAADAAGTAAVPSVPSLTGTWNDATLHAGLNANIGAINLEAGSTYVNASGVQATGSARYTLNTTYAAIHTTGRTTVDAAIATTSADAYDGPKRTATLPSFTLTQKVGVFDITAAVSQSLFQSTTAMPLALASLAEAHLAYGDRTRFRAELQTYRRTTETQAPLSGTGASFTFQLTPTMSIRAWALDLHGDIPDVSGPVVFAQAYLSGESLWLTNENHGFRLDAIYHRTGAATGAIRALDGDLYVPAGRNTSLGFRTELRTTGRLWSMVFSLAP